MSFIQVKIIEDSIKDGVRLTSLELQYPRFIHGQLLTHRMFSRNSSSSRAIPVSKMIDEVNNKPVNPLYWGKNKSGMQAIEEINDADIEKAKEVWNSARASAVEHALKLNELGMHKQIVNRILEPFQHMHTILTATDFDNFFNLRIEDSAQPEIQLLAKAMKAQLDISNPTEQIFHLPYITTKDEEKLEELRLSGNKDILYRSDEEILKLISSARCARVSYLNHDMSEPSFEKDLALANNLLEHKHMSPFEHQATFSSSDERFYNLRGWRSQRYDIERIQ